MGEKVNNFSKFREGVESFMRERYAWWGAFLSETQGKSIVPSDRFWGQEFSGSWIANEFRRWSDSSYKGDKSDAVGYAKWKKLRDAAFASAEGVRSDELAMRLLDSGCGGGLGHDGLEAEEKLIETFRHLRKSDINREYKELRDAEKEHIKSEIEEAQLRDGKSFFAGLIGRALQKRMNRLKANAQDNKGKDLGCSRVEVIDKLYREKALKLTKYKDKAGKAHFIVSGMWLGEVAYEYAQHLLSGGASALQEILTGKVKESGEETGGAAMATAMASSTGGAMTEEEYIAANNDLPF